MLCIHKHSPSPFPVSLPSPHPTQLGLASGLALNLYTASIKTKLGASDSSNVLLKHKKSHWFIHIKVLSSNLFKKKEKSIFKSSWHLHIANVWLRQWKGGKKRTSGQNLNITKISFFFFFQFPFLEKKNQKDAHLLLLTEAWKEGTDQLSLILEYLKQIQCKAEPSFPHKQRWQIYFTWDTNACPHDRHNLTRRWRKCFSK